MSLWQKRAALPILLAHSAHRRHTKPQEFRNLPGALAPFIKLQNALAHRNRYGSHGHTLPYAFLFIKLYYLWKCAKESGIGDHFSLSYRMLSKFAHPTAMQILAPPDEAKAALQKDCFFSQGCLFFTGAFVALEGQLL